jgi:SAM-dependent methyltransferase
MLQQRLGQYLICPACGVVTRHASLYVKNHCEVLRCEACGLGRADASGFDPATYYTKDYFSGEHADGYADYLATEPVLRRQFAREVDFIHRRCPSGDLVEIGCAYGFFLQEAKRYFSVAGIELADNAAAHCRRQGLNVVNGVASEQTLDRLGPANIFVLLDVIEHLPDPFDTLLRCAHHTKAGGRIVLTTGDFGSAVARLAGAHWRLMTPPQHLWFFTAEGFRRWGQRIGMRVESYDHPWKIVPLSLMAYQFGRMIGQPMTAKPGGRIGVPVNLYDAMRIVLRPEAGL